MRMCARHGSKHVCLSKLFTILFDILIFSFCVEVPTFSPIPLTAVQVRSLRRHEDTGPETGYLYYVQSKICANTLCVSHTRWAPYTTSSHPPPLPIFSQSFPHPFPHHHQFNFNTPNSLRSGLGMYFRTSTKLKCE